MTIDTDELRAAIRQVHGCDSAHVESVPVHETFQGRVVWDGVVEVFDLHGHPAASRCYAWSYRQDDGSYRYIAVLAVEPITSPQDAVRASIVADCKLRKH